MAYRWPMRAHRPAVALAAALVLAAGAVPAGAATDGRGNTITVRVETTGVSGAPYVAALRRAVHGPEISGVTVRVVTADRVAGICGPGAEACYSGGRDGRGVIVVPVMTGTAMEATLLHEYGHHVDAVHRHRSGREPNGTVRWWSARRMSERIARGALAPDYSLGWERSTGEVFAEDYVRLNLALPWQLGSVPAPTAAVLAAIRRDLTGSASGPAPRDAGPVETPGEPGATPSRLVVARSGLLAAGEGGEIPFGLLGPGRSVRVTVRAAGPGATGPRVRVRVVCDGVGRGTAVATGSRPAVIARGGLGPAECRVDLTNLGETAASVTARLTLTRPSS